MPLGVLDLVDDDCYNAKDEGECGQNRERNHDVLDVLLDDRNIVELFDEELVISLEILAEIVDGERMAKDDVEVGKRGCHLLLLCNSLVVAYNHVNC